ncbi:MULTISPECIES: threonine aldolase family protein [Bacillota]|jgi:threonine aldolase|uniref:Low specificity L-threonine aldolase n=2 Tax=Amedibacillus TaxID=2749846 RepID=A0A7G9GMR5_9FIRM|nr:MULTISPECIES: low specificity L-threonine aldolase [Bacillota]QNM12097.1 low specificity L-threonine aldolase [[Eubacterium] hominis]MCH4286550.1 low specificity L-threonine aldolase [Amedibacillus hominis]RGB53163.1 low specificity L-threonine aldolase [Absiella sp. AM22-9]RGB59453.1 low specificity L-threonine aldolase [Absiella sp. AM10-20]RGB66574.1 low specificity L-threonine aldolase [Absiella sp. AM09-45]
MISFRNDYSEGACPEIIEALVESNMTQHVGYGEDECCFAAKKAIKEVLEYEDCDIHFLVGGTQANLTVISSILRPYEAVIAVDSGHINVHETGSIEATGHKVVIADGNDGKLSVEGIRKAVKKHEDEHMVKPAMIYISNATEIGTIYHKEELQALRDVCDELGLYLFMDGARLGAALTAEDNDVEFDDLCKYCDVFYIGGTKNGALFGEAVVIVNDDLKKNFRYMIKQRGGMLAKGWLLGTQFQVLFEQGLYLPSAKHANELAQKMQSEMKKLGVSFFIETTTNQIFPILDNQLIEKLQKDYAFQVWEEMDEHTTAMRFVTSWATKQEDVDAFLADFTKLVKG